VEKREHADGQKKVERTNIGKWEGGVSQGTKKTSEKQRFSVKKVRKGRL